MRRVLWGILQCRHNELNRNFVSIYVSYVSTQKFQSYTHSHVYKRFLPLHSETEYMHEGMHRYMVSVPNKKGLKI